MLNFPKKLLALYTGYIIFAGGVGGQKNGKKIYFVFFLYFCPKRNTNSPGEVNFSEKRFFCATLPSQQEWFTAGNLKLGLFHLKNKGRGSRQKKINSRGRGTPEIKFQGVGPLWKFKGWGGGHPTIN